MAEIKIKYSNLIDRRAKVKQAEASGLVMKYDNFSRNWKSGDEPFGILTFDEPVSPTSEDVIYESRVKRKEELRTKSADNLSMPEIKEAIKLLLEGI